MINIPRVENLDFSRVRLDGELVRYGVKTLLETLEGMPDERQEAIVGQALASREAFVARLAETLDHDKAMMVWNSEEGSGEIYNLQEAAQNVADIVLDAVGSQLKE